MELQLQETFPIGSTKGGGVGRVGQSPDKVTEWLNDVQQIEMKCLRVEASPHLVSNQIKPNRTEGGSQKVSAQITRKCHRLWYLVLGPWSSSSHRLPPQKPFPLLLLRHSAALLFKIDSWMSKMAVCLNLNCSFLAFHLTVRLAESS